MSRPAPEAFRCELTSEIRACLKDDGALRLIVDTAAEALAVPIATFSLIEHGHQYFVARKGLDADHTPRSMAFCSYAILSSGPMEVLDAASDPRFSDNPLVTSGPRIRYYLGIPIRERDGHPIGTLCLIDQVPRGPVDDHTMRMLERLAKIGEQIIDLEREIGRPQPPSVHEPDLTWREVMDLLVDDCRTAVDAELEFSVDPTLGRLPALDSQRLYLREVLRPLWSAVDVGGRLMVSAMRVDSRVGVFVAVDSSIGINPEEIVAEVSDDRSGGTAEYLHHSSGVQEVRVWFDPRRLNSSRGG